MAGPLHLVSAYSPHTPQALPGRLAQPTALCRRPPHLPTHTPTHTTAACLCRSAVGAIEGINQIKTGKLQSLSEQQLVGCDPQSNGCGGGEAGWG